MEVFKRRDRTPRLISQKEERKNKKELKGYQRKYSTVEKEALALLLTVKF